MKRISMSICMLFLSVLLFAQASEGSVEAEKKQQPAAVIELPYAPDMVRAAMNDYLSKKGKSRGADLKGFTTFRNTQLLPADSANADLFFKVERKSRQEKEITVVSLLITTPDAGTPTGDSLHYLSMEQGILYLNELQPAIEAYNLESVIKDQNESLIKAEARLKSLVNEGAELEGKKTGLEQKIRNNKADQQKQMQEIEAQKQKLGVRVSQRKA